MISPNMRKKKQTVARVFLGSVRQESREQWLELCRQAISAIDNAAQLHQDYVYEGGSFDLFLKSLRPDNVAVLPYLAALSERPAEGGRVGYAFASRLRRIEARCMYVLMPRSIRYCGRVTAARGMITSTVSTAKLRRAGSLRGTKPRKWRRTRRRCILAWSRT